MTPPVAPDRPGLVDRLLGPGHTVADVVVQLLAGAVGVAPVAWYLAADPVGPPSSVLQTVILAVIVLDLAGGVISNFSVPTKAWHHRDVPQARRGRVLFVAAHVLHLVVIALVLLGGDWAWLVGNVALLAASTTSRSTGSSASGGTGRSPSEGSRSSP
ncbi:MAG: hypothetical protein ACFCVG_10950 [Kineosporiaceae bacterium]